MKKMLAILMALLMAALLLPAYAEEATWRKSRKPPGRCWKSAKNPSCWKRPKVS